MEMKTAFLAMTVHINRTRSSDFFIALLRDFFGDVTVIPHQRVWIDVPKSKWDLIVVWQGHYTPEELEALGADRVVFVPMYDDIPLDEAYWSKYRQFKVFCFSSTLERLLVSYGLTAWGARYYSELPLPVEHEWDELSAFFWQRYEALDWRLVKVLMGDTRFSHVHLHWTPTDEHENEPPPLTEQELASGRFQVSSWFKDSEEYHTLVSRANVFFASRLTEGIGLSFVEAMAMGLCVAAPCRPTMSEYIENGVNGLLYDPDRPGPLDFSRARELGAEARSSCENGRKLWIEALPRLRDFLEEPVPGYRPRRHPFVVAKGLANYSIRKVPGLRDSYRFLRRLVKGEKKK
jgi:glycosyltransferase involved in cell wall biosynthesis